MLHEFISDRTPLIVARSRAKMAARLGPVPTEVALKNGVPLFLSQLVDRLRPAPIDRGEIGASATLHGGELLAMGFSVSQVVHGYGDICQVITELASETDATITTVEFHLFNHCLDDAIASAVTEYERQHDLATAALGAERLESLAHDMRNRLSAATLAYDLLKKGTVAIGGSTGSILGRNLRALRDLITHALIEHRVESGLGSLARVALRLLIDEAVEEVSRGAGDRSSQLVVEAIPSVLEVDIDQEVLAAVLATLFFTALEFNRPAGRISIRVVSSGERVQIEVEDQCGGLLPGQAEDLFGAAKGQSGLGLALSRRAVEAMGGTLTLRDLPRKGCVFTLDLPCVLVP